nr:helix-turn-helix transcriptional regulator [Actinacidiphila glaucinigra]
MMRCPSCTRRTGYRPTITDPAPRQASGRFLGALNARDHPDRVQQPWRASADNPQCFRRVARTRRKRSTVQMPVSGHPGDRAGVLQGVFVIRLSLKRRHHEQGVPHRRDRSPATIAATHRMSVRYVHKLFQDEDMSVSRWINHKRLEACREDLARPATAGSTVGEIARRWGFVSPAHFSRLSCRLRPVPWRVAPHDQ